MKTIRRSIVGLSALMAAWVAISFIGVMFNTGNAGFWTTSLMWSLLASVLVMPTLVIAHHATNRAERADREEGQEYSDEPETVSSSREEQPAFINEREQEHPPWPPVEKEPMDRE